ncbi:MAG: serine esterase [bacterium]|nr:serine esterase [bacterium]
MSKINLAGFEQAYFFESDSSEGKLIIGLHGRGDNANSFSGIRYGLRLKDFSQLYLNAPDEWNVGFARGYSWYDMAPNQLLGIQRSYELLESLLSELEQRGYSREKIILFGFSQGCLMSLELAIRSKRPLMGVIGVSGTIYEVDSLLEKQQEGCKQTPFFITHGFGDDILPFDNSKIAYEKISKYLPDFEFKALPKEHNIADVEWEWYQSKISDWSRRHK